MSDKARVVVRIAALREQTFEVFTREVDSWWRRGRRYRLGEGSVMVLEPRLGGRFFERVGDREHLMGTVTSWEPPRHLVITWRAVNFTDADPSTEIDVSFDRAIGQAGEGTLVTIEHRGFQRVRADHPVRHGQASAAFIASMGRWWGDLAAALREVVAARQFDRGPPS